jgi:uncharacterized protein YbbK (DUF523 family)
VQLESSMEKVLVSACLLGEKVRYHGGSALVTNPILQRWIDEGRIVSVCPEVAGGLPTPRPAAEIRRVPDHTTNRIVVVTQDGIDVSDAYLKGAQVALDLVQQHGIRVAILKDGSPSCGSAFVHDGSFSGSRVQGQGLTASRLVAAGVRVFNETQIGEAANWVATLETTGNPLNTRA